MLMLVGIRNKGNLCQTWGFPGGSDGKNLSAVWETWVQSLGWEDPLEEGMLTHSTGYYWILNTFILGEFPWIEESGRLQSMGLQRVGHN